MKKRIHLSVALFSICLLALCASSCISGDMDCKTIEEQSKVNILLTTRTSNSGMSGSEETKPGTENENSIVTLRAIAYKVYESGSSVTYGEQLLNVTFPSSEVVKLTVDKGQKVRVFLIANGGSLSLGSKSLSVEDLKKFVVAYDSKIETPLLMFGESRTFNGLENESAIVSMERNVARVDLTLTYRSDNSNFNNGTLRFTEALIHRMTTKAGLGTPLASIIGEYRSSEPVAFNYTNIATDNVFTTNTLTFYVPEHIVADTKKYTYITIKGTFTPNGGATSIPVEYDLPVGENIKTDMLPDNSFTVEDLRINRNHLYDMRAKVENLQQISEVHVKVTPWTDKEVSGDIKPDDARYYLNVLDIKPTLKAGETIKIQFWSNRPADEIKILPTGTIKGSKDTFNTDEIFVSLAGNAGITMQEGEKWGRLTLQFAKGKAVVGKTYVITLAAGVLQRTIEVTAAE